MTETNKKQAKAKPAAAIVKAPKAAPAKAAKPDGAALPAGVYSIGADGLSPLFFADLTAVGAIIVDGRGKGSRGACSTRRLAEMLPAGRVVAAPDLTSDDHDRRDAAIADLAKLAGSIAVILVTHEQAPVDDRRYEICDLIAPEFGAPLAPVYHLCGGEVVAHAELRTSIAMDRDYDCESYFSAAQIPAAVRDLLA